MTYCYKCGSEIGEAEGFCPFCGITLKPIVVNEEEQEAENEFVHEIVDENAEVKPENAVETAQSDVDLLMSETVMINPGDLKSKNIESAENVSSFKEILPLESEIENIHERSANKDSELPVNSGIADEIKSDKSEFAKQAEPTKLSDEPESNDFNDGEIANDLEFNATIPYVPLMDKQVKEVASDLNIEKEKEADNLLEIDEYESTSVETAADENIKSDNDKFNNDLSVPAEKPESVDIETISKSNAEDDLTKKPFEIDDEPITTIQGSKELNPSKFTKTASEQKNAAGEEVISSTTPNINATDTGGKSNQLKPLEEGTVLNGRYEIVRKIGG
ncbi:MAG: hypothetical protein ACR2J3_04820, partial [Aridibacter sp.]